MQKEVIRTDFIVKLRGKWRILCILKARKKEDHSLATDKSRPGEMNGVTLIWKLVVCSLQVPFEKVRASSDKKEGMNKTV